jgi:hypothetical protein
MADEYPEHEKLKGLGGSNQIVGDFIEWLGEHKIELAQWNPSGTYCMPIHRSRDDRPDAIASACAAARRIAPCGSGSAIDRRSHWRGK